MTTFAPAERRIGLILPSSNCMAEPQFHRFAPRGVDIQVTRLRMTGRWHRPLAEAEPAFVEAAAALSDTDPDVIVFNCTAASMEEGLAGERRIVAALERASNRPVLTTGQAVSAALERLGIERLVLVSPYPKRTNREEIRYLEEAGFQVLHDVALGLGGGPEYIAVTPARWKEIVRENRRAQADGYFLSCTNTTMIETVEDLERELEKPVITSNQAALWAALARIEMLRPIPELGSLFASP
jgi:maleate isomerase